MPAQPCRAVPTAHLPAAPKAAVRHAPALLALLLAALLGTSTTTSVAQTAPLPAPLQPTAPAQLGLPLTINNSSLEAPLFYQLLIGELELRQGAAGTAYEVILDAARKTGDEALFQRATEIALQARAGDQALAAAQAWRSAAPTSAEAHRYLVQLLVLLNRPAETLEPLRSLITLTPQPDKSLLIASVPRFFARSPDRKASATLVNQLLQPYTEGEQTDTRLPALLASGLAWLAAEDGAQALRFAQRAQAIDPQADGPVLLALQLLPQTGAEALVQDSLQRRPDNNTVRMAYAQALSGAQRYGDAAAQLEQVTRSDPKRASAWLTLGALHLELRHPKEALAALQTFVALAEANPPPASAAPAPAADTSAQTPSQEAEAGAGADDATPLEQGLTQAWLMMAQASEQLGDFKGAEGWLSRVTSPQRALDVQQRRASLLAKQGRLPEARALIRSLPDTGDDTARAKLLAEVQLLRDAKQWKEALALLTAANTRFADDVDLLYEQAMLAEKLDRVDEMERLLRRVITLKPEHSHAHNALGYSLAERNLRLPEAKALIERALVLSPGEPFITDSLGWVEYRLGNLSEALRLLREAYRARPDPEIGAHLGEVLWTSGQQDEARKIWREARTRDQANDVLRETLARLRAKL